MVKQLCRKRKLLNEEGSTTLEFLGILPYFFLIFILLWQVVISGFTIMSAQTAVNEAAKVYAVTESVAEAQSMAQEIVGSGGASNFLSFSVNGPDGNGYFEARLNVSHGLVFVPEIWRNSTAITLNHTTNGRVIR